MTANTGRTSSKWIDFYVDDVGGTLRQILISGIDTVGLKYDGEDMTAFQDAVKGAVNGMPDAPIKIHGPFDTTCHGYLSGIVGGATPLALDVQFGIRHAWEAGEPTFGITGGATDGYLCTSYTVNADLSFDAEFVVFAGSIAPAWDTAAHT